jgi:agmatine/peptidylarginine deiminase
MKTMNDTPTNTENIAVPEQLEIWVNNPNSCQGWVRDSGPFTSRSKTEKRVRDLKFDAVKGCRFSIRPLS